MRSAKNGGRAIDLQFRFTTLDADVLVARRGTNQYGGLNVRLSAAPDQQIEALIDPAAATPRRAWTQRSGTPGGGKNAVGLAILQHAHSPKHYGANSWNKRSVARPAGSPPAKPTYFSANCLAASAYRVEASMSCRHTAISCA